ncbi:hypothetical protein Pmani_006346 [Petrolisthes manimaculis]|uniref:Uncharacterized protein n=1 Tax=Petrolisthes manimaculis TaxID=1843537 RepID=A0AAE1QBY7_9EUCA|nr:hypothetical protein Pmani_006346 [Petrolisthes manimaculis]
MSLAGRKEEGKEGKKKGKKKVRKKERKEGMKKGRKEGMKKGRKEGSSPRPRSISHTNPTSPPPAAGEEVRVLPDGSGWILALITRTSPSITFTPTVFPPPPKPTTILRPLSLYHLLYQPPTPFSHHHH